MALGIGAFVLAVLAPAPVPKDGAEPSVPPVPSSPVVGGVRVGDAEGGPSLQYCQRFAPTTRFRITLPQEATLDDLMRWISTMTCQRFIADPKLRTRKLTMISPEPVTLTEAWGAFHAALQVMGLTVVPAGKALEVVELPDSKQRPTPVTEPDKRPADNDQVVTHLYRTKSGDSAEIAELMGHFIGKNGSVHPVDDLVVLTDSGANIRRILEIVAVVDKPPPPEKRDKVHLYQLKHADPEHTAEIIREVIRQRAESK